MRQNVFRSAWKVAAAAMIVAGAFCGQAHAVNDVLAKWTFEGATAPVGTPTFSGNFNEDANMGNVASGTHVGATTWSTPAGNGSAKALSANVWAASDWWEFTAADLFGGSPTINYGLQFDQVSSTSGPRDWKVQYSTDGSNFLDVPGATYKVQPNATPAWSGNGVVAPLGLDTYEFDLRSISASVGAGSLASNANAKLRLTAASPAVAAQQGTTFNGTGGTNRIDNVTIFHNYSPPLTPPVLPPVLPATGDVVFGIGSGREKTTLELVRGTAVLNGGSKPAPYSSYTAQNFIRYVKFDNLGTAHNVHGNLLAVDTGASAAAGGNIYSYATQGSNPSPAPQLLATTNTASGAVTTLGGLSVAPGNSKIAVSGFTTGKVLVYDYAAGNGLGTGSPTLTGLRQSAAILGTGANYSAGTQQGTVWKDDDTVLAFAGDGKLYTVDATSMANFNVKTVALTTATQSSTALAYNPAVSQYVYATYSSFVATGTVTSNKLFIFDPTTAYSEVTPAGGIDFSTSAFAIRDIALDASGNLFFSTSGSTGGGQGRIEYIPGVASTLGSTTANSSIDWYLDEVFGGVQSGLDIGFAPPAGIAGDYNSDGKVNAQDYVLWRKSPGAHGGDPAGYNAWRANFGTGGLGSGSGLDGASVPEPASALLLVLGLAAFCPRRRSA